MGPDPYPSRPAGGTAARRRDRVRAGRGPAEAVDLRSGAVRGRLGPSLANLRLARPGPRLIHGCPDGRIAIRAASSWCGVVPQQGPGLRTLLSGSGGQLGRTGRRQAGHSGQGRMRALKLQGLSWLKARRRRGVVREGCLDRREPSRIGVRYGRARCCRYGKGVPGCTLRMIGSSLGSTRDHDPRG